MASGHVAARRITARRWAIAGLGTAVATGVLASAGISRADDDNVLTSEPTAETAATAVEATTTTTSEPVPTTTQVPTTTTTEPPPPTTTTTEPPPPPTTEAPTTTTTEPPPPANEPLRQGDQGEEVRALQERLAGLGYWLGEADGTYGQTTQQAVMAFQKNEGLGRDGVAGEATMAQLDGASRPTGRSTAGNVIEIDLQRQLMLLIQDGEVIHVLNTSTGRPGAGTPTGEYIIGREIDGWRHAPLGTLYRPKYFNQGIALHGADSIPGYPASAGCARLSNAATDMVWASGLAEVGTKVWVY